MSNLNTEFSIVNHAPKVFVIGASQMQNSGMESYLDYRGVQWNRVIDDHTSYGTYRQFPLQNSTETIVEASGRVCYHSWNNHGQKTTKEYIQSSIVEHSHGSVLEHIWLNFMVADLPRSSQLELVRHGDGTAFSFESTRFTDEHMRFILPPRIRGNVDATELWYESVSQSARLYRTLVAEIDVGDEAVTLKRKRRKEAGRSILPMCLGSDGAVSMNARALRWITEVRSDIHADLSIREFANALFLAALDYIPSVLADATCVTDEIGQLFSVTYKTKKV